ncbi:MAG TPA: 50S ribosomal protein L21e [bacterium]|nr:50S ribosomal protein L21e [bacterium]
MPNKKAKGKRAKSRHKMKKRGPKVTVNKMLQEIPDGSIVDVHIDSSVHSGLPDKKYKGKTGTVIRKQGTAFLVHVKDGNQDRILVVGPAHLRISKGVQAPVEKDVKIKQKVKA